MSNDRLLCEADRARRVITLHCRPDMDKAEALELVSSAWDVIAGLMHSEVPIERWARMLPADIKALTNL